MTEQELERKIEAAADKLEDFIERKWRNPFFRKSMKLLSLSAEISLLIGSFGLKNNGYKRAAGICFILAIIGIAADIITSLFFKYDGRN